MLIIYFKNCGRILLDEEEKKVQRKRMQKAIEDKNY